MKMYTKTGDDGFTDRDGRRVRKSESPVEAVGAVDELTSSVGWCRHAAGGAKHEPVAEALRTIQPELLAVGAMLASAGTGRRPAVVLDESVVVRMEGQIDRATGELPELRRLVIPGGCELACRLHVARTVCRRAERAAAAVGGDQKQVPPIVLKYLNRLSDLLFVLARQANAAEGIADDTWQPGGQG